MLKRFTRTSCRCEKHHTIREKRNRSTSCILHHGSSKLTNLDIGYLCFGLEENPRLSKPYDTLGCTAGIHTLQSLINFMPYVLMQTFYQKPFAPSKISLLRCPRSLTKSDNDRDTPILHSWLRKGLSSRRNGQTSLCAHKVEIQHAGGTTALEVEEGDTILEAALEAGLKLSHDCKMGVRCWNWSRHLFNALMFWIW